MTRQPTAGTAFTAHHLCTPTGTRDRNDVAIIDAGSVGEPFQVKRVELIGSVQYSEVHGENALLTLSQPGVQWLDLSE